MTPSHFFTAGQSPTVSPLGEEHIGIETRDGTPSQITLGFSITNAIPSVDDITWTYTPTRGNTAEAVDVKALANSNDKYMLSNDLKTLTIFTVNFTDAGFFTLNATNIIGSNSATLELTVHGM